MKYNNIENQKCSMNREYETEEYSAPRKNPISHSITQCLGYYHSRRYRKTVRARSTGHVQQYSIFCKWKGYSTHEVTITINTCIWNLNLMPWQLWSTHWQPIYCGSIELIHIGFQSLSWWEWQIPVYNLPKIKSSKIP